MAARKVVDNYDRMAAKYARVDYDARRTEPAITARHLNNFVKACLADVAARALRRGEPLRLADVAAGRGQDQNKWAYAAQAAAVRWARYWALDLSPCDAAMAKSRAKEYVEPFTGAANAQFVVGDAAQPEAWETLPAGSANVVSCQLALHYLCGGAGEGVHQFFQQAKRVATADGLLLVSFADGGGVVRRARAAAAAASGTGPEDPVHVAGKYYELRVPRSALAAAVASPWGHAYTFSMPGTVDSVPEFVAEPGVVAAAAAAAGWGAPVLSAPFDVLAASLAAAPRFAAVAERMGGHGLGDADAVDAANLYRAVVWAASQAAREAFLAALSAEPARDASPPARQPHRSGRPAAWRREWRR